MISSIGTAPTGSSSHALDRTAKMADLKKQVSNLQQKLTLNQDTKPEELAGLRANSISQDISTVKAQIEKASLDAQLDRLSLVYDAQATAEAAKNSATGNSAADPPEDGTKNPAQADGNSLADKSSLHARTRRSHGRTKDEGVSNAATEAYMPPVHPTSRLSVQA